MKIKIKALVVLALIVSVVVVSGCASQPAVTSGGATGVSEVKSQEDAAKTVLDSSKNVKKISDTLDDIDKTLAGK